MNLSAARLRVINSSLKFCIQVAWNVNEYRVSGGPAWTETDHYDIEAVSAAPFQKGEFRIMLQTLLAERFGLVVHRETQQKMGYSLVVARGGSKLPPPQDDPDILFSRTPTGDRTLQAKGATLESLAMALSGVMGATVVNRTGIAGKFDVSLQWTPDSSEAPMLSKSGEPLPPRSPDAPAGPSIHTVLQEKLGLKLEPAKVPTEVIVIDRANRPTEN